MRDEILQELVTRGVVTGDLIDQVRPHLGAGASLVGVLTHAGIDPERVLEAAVRVTGIPRVPAKWEREPAAPDGLGSMADRFIGAGAVPVGTHKGRLCVAYFDPSQAKRRATGVPDHRALLTTEVTVRRLQAEVFGKQSPPSGPVDGGGVYKVRQSQKVDVAGQQTVAAPRLPSGAMEALKPPDTDVDATLMDLAGARPDPAALEDPTIRTPRATEESTGPYDSTPTMPVDESEPQAPAEGRRGRESRTLDEAREAALHQLKDFRVRRVLGRGGMATVYLADDLARGGKVALKLIEPHLADDDEFVERFRREVKASAALAHENVVRLFDSGARSGVLYMASEYVDGGTLRDLLFRMGPLPVAIAAPIFSQAIAGLGAAHKQGIVHRDLKPANILLSTAGVVKVGDFGVAKSRTDNTITQSGMLFGTPAYMSPEQAFGKTLDGRSDLFSMSTLAYELLTGHNPYHHDNMSTSLLMVSKVQARPIAEVCPQLPGLFEEVLSNLMQRKPEQRYADADAVVAALAPLVDAITARHGNVIADAVNDPEGTGERLRKEQARAEVRHAQAALHADPPRTREAAWCFYKARTLDPTEPVASQELTRLAQQHGVRFEAEGDAAIQEIEEALTEKKRSPALLRRGAELHLKRDNLLGGTVWLRRYLRMQPSDQHMRHTLESIVGTDPLAPFTETPQSDPPSLDLATRPTRSLDAGQGGAPNAAPVVALPDWDATYKSSSKPSPSAPPSPPAGSRRKGVAIAAGVVVVLAVVIVGASVTFGGVGDGGGVAPTSTGGPTQPTVPSASAAQLERQKSLFRTGQALADQGKLAAAVDKFGDALELDAGSDLAADLLIARGRVFANLRRFDDARADFEKATLLVEADDPRRGDAERYLNALP